VELSLVFRFWLTGARPLPRPGAIVTDGLHASCATAGGARTAAMDLPLWIGPSKQTAAHFCAAVGILA
jgi:hypothetical protein